MFKFRFDFDKNECEVPPVFSKCYCVYFQNEFKLFRFQYCVLLVFVTDFGIVQDNTNTLTRDAKRPSVFSPMTVKQYRYCGLY